MKIRDETAQYVAENFAIPPEVTEVLFDVGLFREDLAKRVIIREQYFARSSSEKKSNVKEDLAQKFCTSVSTIEKIVSNELNDPYRKCVRF